ncbi:MAG: hypothetical protein ACLP62_13635 [Acidimicrobiales bacterium]
MLQHLVEENPAFRHLGRLPEPGNVDLGEQRSDLLEPFEQLVVRLLRFSFLLALLAQCLDRRLDTDFLLGEPFFGDPFAVVERQELLTLRRESLERRPSSRGAAASPDGLRPPAATEPPADRLPQLTVAPDQLQAQDCRPKEAPVGPPRLIATPPPMVAAVHGCLPTSRSTIATTTAATRP